MHVFALFQLGGEGEYSDSGTLYNPAKKALTSPSPFPHNIPFPFGSGLSSPTSETCSPPRAPSRPQSHHKHLNSSLPNPGKARPPQTSSIVMIQRLPCDCGALDGIDSGLCSSVEQVREEEGDLGSMYFIRVLSTRETD